MSQSNPTPDGIITIFVADYDRTHFRIVPTNGKRLGTPRGLQSTEEAILRRQLYAIPGQDSPDFWIPPRWMRNPYYEFTTRQMPPEGQRSSLMITRRVVEGQRALAFEHEVRDIIVKAFGWEHYRVVNPTRDTRSAFKVATDAFKSFFERRTDANNRSPQG